MTEAEWLAWKDPDRLLWLPLLRGKISDRKMRLFACACCRRIWDLLTDKRSRAVAEVAERYADGLATPEELNAARETARDAVTEPVLIGGTAMGTTTRTSPTSVALCAAATEYFSPRPAAHLSAMFVEYMADGDRVAFAAEREAQGLLFRDLVGNPFRPVTVDPVWLVWNGGTIVQLALAAYDERELPSGHLDTVRLALLADALEDAGCTEPTILEHLRGSCPHVRGCWAVDLLLGKT